MKRLFKILTILFIIQESALSLSAIGTSQIFYEGKLWPSFFNDLGGLDFLVEKYATLIITKNGGIAIADHFISEDDGITEHNVTIDSIYRGKTEYWKNHVSIEATFYYRRFGKLRKDTGNGIFPFPKGATAHLFGLEVPTSIVTDLYAQTHVSTGTTPSSPSPSSSTSSSNQPTSSPTPGTAGSTQTNQVPSPASNQPQSPVNSQIPNSTHPSTQVPTSTPSQPQLPHNGGATTAIQYLYQGNELGGGGRSATLQLSIFPSTQVEGSMRVRGTCLPHGPAWMGAKLILKGHMFEKPKRIEGSISGTNFVENCPTAGGSFSTTTYGNIRLDFRSSNTLEAKISDRSGATRWIFHRVAPGGSSSNLPDQTPFTVAGVWNTEFGTMRLYQRGRSVWGTYTHDSGKIQGTLRGRTLVGQWSESPSYRPPKDAGDFYFRFSDDGRSFKGKWRYGFGGSAWEDHWNGFRSSPTRR